jgi:hypothetical protein
MCISTKRTTSPFTSGLLTARNGQKNHVSLTKGALSEHVVSALDPFGTDFGTDIGIGYGFRSFSLVEAS